MNIDDNLDINNPFENVEFCSSPVYKSIVTLILFGIIVYFIWFLCRKIYKEDYTEIEVSTPFDT